MLNNIPDSFIYEAELHFILKSEKITVLVTHKLPIKAGSKKEAYQKALMNASQTIDAHNVNEQRIDIMEYIGISALNLKNEVIQKSLSQKMLENEKELFQLIQKLRLHNLIIQQDLAQATI